MNPIKTFKTMRPTKTIQRPLTDEEKQQRIMQFLTQKRETFSINILSAMLQGAVTNKDVTNIQCKSLVDLAVEMADVLLEKLYPIKEEKTEEEKPKEETPAEMECGFEEI